MASGIDCLEVDVPGGYDDPSHLFYRFEDGDLFKGGFGGQGLYVSPARDLVIAFAGTPQADGSTNLLRWYSRRLARSLPLTG